jgi:hypothetical protein
MPRLGEGAKDMSTAGAVRGTAGRPVALGPAGRWARLGVGLAAVALALLEGGPNWRDAMLGLVVMPALAAGVMALRVWHWPRPLRVLGPRGHVLGMAIMLLLMVPPVVDGAALVFYGVAMLTTAARGHASSELTAVSNVVLGRDDQVGCDMLTPVDLVEQRLRRSPTRAVDRG